MNDNSKSQKDAKDLNWEEVNYDFPTLDLTCPVCKLELVRCTCISKKDITDIYVPNEYAEELDLVSREGGEVRSQHAHIEESVTSYVPLLKAKKSVFDLIPTVMSELDRFKHYRKRTVVGTTFATIASALYYFLK